MIRVGLGFISLVLAAGAIDGPTGFENDNWGLCIAFALLGMGLIAWGLPSATQNNDDY